MKDLKTEGLDPELTLPQSWDIGDSLYLRKLEMV